MFRHEPEAVLKDNDLRARARFRFSPSEARAIKNQLFHDSNFLRDLGVMDYSLLGCSSCPNRSHSLTVAVYKKVTPLIVEVNLFLLFNFNTNRTQRIMIMILIQPLS